MSKESVKLFLKKMAADAGFAKKFREYQNAKERVAFAKKAGFELTEEELQKVDGELSESDLDEVAGGLRDYPTECTTNIGDDTRYKV